MTTKLLAAVLFLLPLLAVGCGGGDGGGGGDETIPFGLEKQTVTSADFAEAMAFAPDGRLFFAEKFTGDIRIVGADGKALSDPFAHLDVADWLHLDWGLTGLALDPNFASNHFVYAFYSQPVESPKDLPISRPVLVRFTEQNNKGSEQTVLVADFANSRQGHQGFKTNGRIHFGPDGNLYLNMGDYDWGKTGPNGTGAAQDLSLPMGKFLRVDTAGKALPDNPFIGTAGADPRVFAIGFAAGFDFAFHPQSGKLYGTDATDSCEELDIVQAGGNYGWPNVGDFPFSDCYFGDQVKAIGLLARPGRTPGQFQSYIGARGMAFVSATKYPQMGDGLLICGSETKLMQRLKLPGPGFDQVTADDPVVKDCNGAIATAPDGTVYYSNDTQITRLVQTQVTAAPASTGGGVAPPTSPAP